MADEKRYAWMDASGNVLEVSACKPEYAAEWAQLHGYARYEDMDDADGKARMIEPGDRFSVARNMTKGGGLAAMRAR